MSQIEQTNPMPTTEHLQAATFDTSPRPVSSCRLNRVQNHTHVQQVGNGQLVNWNGGGLMALDRGTLARIDRRVFAELGNAAATQVVKVPLSDASWSTWRRYCQALGLTMGEGIAGLITHELLTSLDALGGDGDPVFERRDEERLVARELLIASRERDIEDDEERHRYWTERLRIREVELLEREWRILLSPRPVGEPEAAGRKVGRNERCPCGSGLKYKRCHGP